MSALVNPILIRIWTIHHDTLKTSTYIKIAVRQKLITNYDPPAYFTTEHSALCNRSADRIMCSQAVLCLSVDYEII